MDQRDNNYARKYFNRLCSFSRSQQQEPCINENITRNPNTGSKHGSRYIDSQLINACKFSNYEKIKDILYSTYRNIDARDAYNNTPLMICSKNGDLKSVDLLLTWDADIDLKNIYDETALMIASNFGRFDVVKKLLEFIRSTECKCKIIDMNIHNTDRSGRNALMLAVRRNHYKIAKEILDIFPDGANYNINTPDRYQNTPLMEACWNRNLDMVKLLIENGAIIDYSNYTNQTALICACTMGHLEIVKYLFIHNPTVLLDRAFYISAYNGHLDICKLFVERATHVGGGDVITTTTTDTNDDPDITTYFERTTLLYQQPKHLPDQQQDQQEDQQEDQQQENKFNINTRDNYGNTALILATLNGHLEIVRYLIKQGANISIINVENKNALDVALSINESGMKITKMLMLCGLRGNHYITRQSLYNKYEIIENEYQQHLNELREKSEKVENIFLTSDQLKKVLPKSIMKEIVWKYYHYEPSRIDYIK